MRNKFIFTLILLCCISLYSCNNSSSDSIKPASERIENSVNSLKNLLVSQPNGWHIIYFPNVNKSLNTDITENIKTSDNSLIKFFLKDRLGVGGYNIYVKFANNGVCQMYSDIPNIAKSNEEKLNLTYNDKVTDVGYKVFISDELSLMFTTNNPIENLFDYSLNVKTKFGIVSIDKATKQIVLTTNTYESSDREYIVMMPMKKEFSSAPSLVDKAVENVTDFRNRLYVSNNDKSKDKGNCFFIITTKKDNKEVYRSTSSFAEKIIDDRVSMQIPRNWDNRTINLIHYYDVRRYTLFVKNEEPDKTIGDVDKSQYYTAIGSGYVPTSDGLFFYPGFNYLGIANFQNFTKVSNKEWVAESSVYKAQIIFINK